MYERCIPQYWKIAYVSPIFKKGARNKAENYRPVSLTSVLCKLIKSFVKDSIITHMKAEYFLSSKQYGFMNGDTPRHNCSLILISALILHGSLRGGIEFEHAQFDVS